MSDELRVISLLSCGTEILHALGLGHFQVGRSHECDFPPAVESLPVCSRPNIAVDGSSAEIDRLVTQRAANAVSIYDLDSERIAALRPTRIITQTQCKVCAVSLDDVERALQQTTGTQARVVSLEPHTLAGIWEDIRRVACSCGRPDAGETLVQRLVASMASIQRRASTAGTKPRVACIEWLEPVMTAGNWIPELIRMASGADLFGVAGQHSPYLEWQQIANADPDVLIAFPCGFDLARTKAEMHWLSGRSGWAAMRAVRDRRVFVCDGNQYMNRPGPRLVESLRIFAEILHPELFEPSLLGLGWERYVPAP